MPKVVVLGGSYAGLAVVHHLLKHALPKQKDLKVVLVSKNSHFYWNIASVRAVVPGVLETDRVLQPIEPGLAQYPAGSVELMVGAAVAMDPAAKTVTVEPASGGGTDTDAVVVPYDYLVLATGSRSPDADMPWKAAGSHEELRYALGATAARVGAASHIVVAGAGPTGVELCGEIRYASPDKTVVLLCKGPELVDGDSIAGAVENELRRLGVDVRKGVHSTAVEPVAVEPVAVEPVADQPGSSKTRVTLSDGSEILTDLFLPTMGVVPNTEYLPAALLGPRGYVLVDAEMRVDAAIATDVWAVGDVVSVPRSSYVVTEAQAPAVAANVALAMLGREQKPVRGVPVDIFFCAVGRSRGAGRLGPVSVPSLVVHLGKGRTLGVQRTEKYVSGKMW